jgi:hypothetical protein
MIYVIRFVQSFRTYFMLAFSVLHSGLIGYPARAENGGVAPHFFSLPQSQNLGQGLRFYLSVDTNPGTGSGLSFQWFQNGSPIVGATNSFLSRTNTTFADSGDYVITAANSAGSVTSSPVRINIVPAAQLHRVYTIPTPFAFWVKVINHKAYIADGKLEIYDVSNPYAPIKLGSYSPQTAPVYAFSIEGQTAYVNDDRVGGLVAVDISNPALPSKIGHSPDGITNLDIMVRNGIVYCATNRGMDVYDVTDPTKPKRISSYEVGSEVYTIELMGNVAFLATIRGGVQLLDITNPTNPQFITSLNEIMGADTVKIVGDRLYTAGNNFAIYDLKDPRAPRLLGVQSLRTTSGSSQAATGMSASGNFMFSGHYTLEVYDTSNPEQTAFINEFSIGAEGIDIVGNFIYVANSKGVDVLEWTGATNLPVVMAPFTNSFSVFGVPARLQANASGGEELRWQWFKQGNPLPGETNRFLKIPAVDSTTIGEYSIEAGNSAGKVSAGTAILDVIDPPLLDLSIRLGDSRGPRLRFNLPVGFQSRMEGSDLGSWNVIWSGQSEGGTIEVFDGVGKGRPARFYRLKYGLDLN